MLEYREEFDVAVISVVGELIGEEFEAKIAQLLAQGRNRLVINLDKVHPVYDSVGFAELIRANNSVNKTRGKLVLAHSSRRLADLFHRTKIDEVFIICGSEKKAIARCRKRVRQARKL